MFISLPLPLSPSQSLSPCSSHCLCLYAMFFVRYALYAIFFVVVLLCCIIVLLCCCVVLCYCVVLLCIVFFLLCCCCIVIWCTSMIMTSMWSSFDTSSNTFTTSFNTSSSTTTTLGEPNGSSINARIVHIDGRMCQQIAREFERRDQRHCTVVRSRRLPCVFVFIYRHIHSYIQTFIYTDIHIYIHTYIHKYIHTFLHTYITHDRALQKVTLCHYLYHILHTHMAQPNTPS